MARTNEGRRMGERAEGWLHFSPEPVLAVHDEPVLGDCGNGKPHGFWFSHGLHWLEWCKAESFRLEDAKMMTRVTLAPSGILHITDLPTLRDFHRKYRRKDAEHEYQRRYIDWPRVCAEYDGLTIAPYQWDARHSIMWYYGWDVASGVVWRSRGIVALSEPAPVVLHELLPEEAVA